MQGAIKLFFPWPTSQQVAPGELPPTMSTYVHPSTPHKEPGPRCTDRPRKGLDRPADGASHLFLSFGFNISSNAKPMSVKPSTTSTMHRPGAMIHQWSPM